MSATWRDIVRLEHGPDAQQAIEKAVSGMTVPVEFIEFIGARQMFDVMSNIEARLNAYDGELHHLVETEAVPDLYLEDARKQVTQRAYLRWESSARRRLLAELVLKMADELRRRAEHLGIRLPREPRDTILDAVVSKDL